MYNLLVSGGDGTWDGEPLVLELDRCVREYTDSELTKRFGELDSQAVSELKKLPCIFAYEDLAAHPEPQFGVLRDITKRQGRVRIEYEVQHIEPFLSKADLKSLSFELDIGKWELNRTHWAVKDVSLPRELKTRGITLPEWTRDYSKAVDISTHAFDVALSFPGEIRPTVERIAAELERRIGPRAYFYDNNFVSQLARPSLDVLLQDIYRNRSRLVVVFLSGDYQRKDWCGVEFRAIREIIMAREHNRIMFVKMDDGAVDGVFRTDGYIDGRRYTPAEIAGFIEERLRVLGSGED